MLKITTDTSERSRRLRVEGSLAGPWVKELEQSWRGIASSPDQPPVIDLTGVTFIDDEGKALLRNMRHAGAKLIASGCYTRSIVEGICECARLEEPQSEE
ncbi:MAG TPA: hypothetical protein VFS39_15960 [Nitrospira sp.]|nr:hypothetical protein [Nitrospira sp.]